MVLSWNEIKKRAIAFSNEWAETRNEEADAKPFLVEFFNVFGVSSRKVATFEYRVKKLDEKDGYIDLLWKGTILVEMKSRGKSLDKAFQQAKDYLHGLKQHELPKYILVSDFENFKLYDLEEGVVVEFKLIDLAKNVQHFGYLLGYQKKIFKEQDPANIKAAEVMGKLHDRLKEIGYDGHKLEVYLVRLLFCLFAEDTTIFNKQQFQDYIENRTSADGSDLAAKLQELFQVLNTPREGRFRNLDEDLIEFPYVNGKLFEESLSTASFDSKMRQTLLECCYIDWSQISPAIFGSMFQSVMNPIERRNLGAHYTSEKNILKLIKPLFLDDLWAEFESIKGNKNKLPEFHKKISNLKFLDPACGCGNFLVITYRELRLLEIEILRALNKSGQGAINVSDIIWLDVDMMYGIEYEEFPARIAEVAMWLIDHQMNMLVSVEFGQYFVRLPLKKAANIVHGNALQIDWGDLLSLNNSNYDFITNELIVSVQQPVAHYGKLTVKTQKLTKEKTITKNINTNSFDYILGNPPFIGTAYQSDEQKIDLEKIFNRLKSFGMLDYVSAWFAKAAEFIQNSLTKVAFVSTNSIIQGEQVGILWGYLFNIYGVRINFAHRTFSWSNEAKGNAAVHVVIIGFANFDTTKKTIFEYENIKGEPHEVNVKKINQYLIDAKEIIISPRSNPICAVPKIGVGSALLDDGNLILSGEERLEILRSEPQLKSYIKRFWSADEFLNNKEKWCLWLKDIKPDVIQKSKTLKERISKIKDFRSKSKRKKTHEMAICPYLFGEERQPTSNFLIIPKVSSENRKYIPIGYMTAADIITDKVFFFPNATNYHFGILTSQMHMTWLSNICGRLESRFSYSNTIVYNNYPWPEKISNNQMKSIEIASQNILNIREEYTDSSLGALYNTLAMPPNLLKAHLQLDKAVDLAYRTQPFSNDANRMEYLFELYEKYSSDLFTVEKPKKKLKEKNK